jgi:hypothetical protein
VPHILRLEQSFQQNDICKGVSDAHLCSGIERYGCIKQRVKEHYFSLLTQRSAVHGDLRILFLISLPPVKRNFIPFSRTVTNVSLCKVIILSLFYSYIRRLQPSGGTHSFSDRCGLYFAHRSVLVFLFRIQSRKMIGNFP